MMHALPPKIGIDALDLATPCPPVAKIEIGERLKGRLERGQAFGGRFGARKFLMVEGERSVGILDRDERTRTPPFAKGAVGAVLAFKRGGVELPARNPLARRERVGACGLVRFWMTPVERLVPGPTGR